MLRASAEVERWRAETTRFIADWMQKNPIDLAQCIAMLRLKQAQHESNAMLLSFRLPAEREAQIRAQVERDLRLGNTSRDPDVRSIDEGNALNERAWMLLDLLDAFDAVRRSELAEATALLTREVLCEKIYRERAKWNAEHPNRSLGIRDVNLEAVIDVVDTRILKLSKKQVRALAATVLDAVELLQTTNHVSASRHIRMVMDWLDENPPEVDVAVP